MLLAEKLEELQAWVSVSVNQDGLGFSSALRMTTELRMWLRAQLLLLVEKVSG